jgi:hypothetical protein
MKRMLLGCLVALLLIPAAAYAVYPVGDGPGGVRAENGPAPAVVQATAPPVVTTHESSQTLPVVLAALALSIAITASGYVVLRVRPMLRS